MEESPASGNPTESRCNKSTQKLEEEKLLMGVFLHASPAPPSVWAVRASLTQLQPFARNLKTDRTGPRCLCCAGLQGVKPLSSL